MPVAVRSPPRATTAECVVHRPGLRGHRCRQLSSPAACCCAARPRSPGGSSASRSVRSRSTRTASTRRSTAPRSSCSSSATRSPPDSAQSCRKETLGARLATRLAKATRAQRAAADRRAGRLGVVDAGRAAGEPARVVPSGCRRDHRRRQRRHPPGAGRRSRCATSRRRSPTSGGGRRGGGRQLSRPRRAAAGAAAAPRAGLARLPPAGRGPAKRPRWAPAHTRSRWRTSSGPSSSPTPTRCSAWTGSTRAPPATSAPPRRCCPRCSPRSGSRTTCRSATDVPTR